MRYSDEDDDEYEDFTTNASSTDQESTSGVSRNSNILLVILMKEEYSHGNIEDNSHGELSNNTTIAEMLLDRKIGETIRAELLNRNYLAWILDDLDAAYVPMRHSFELTEQKPIHHRSRRTAPRQYEVIEAEVGKILDTFINVLASSA